MKKNAIALLLLLTPLLSTPVYANESTTSAYFSQLLTDKNYAELTQFLNQMPKGGDLHHHFSGSLYVEDYLQFLLDDAEKNNKNYCVVTEDNAQKYGLPIYSIVEKKPRTYCMDLKFAMSDQKTYTNLQKVWSQLDYFNHIHIQDTPYNHFFDTFSYFADFAKWNTEAGLNKIIARAESENVSYIETMLEASVTLSKTNNEEIKVLVAALDKFDCQNSACDTAALYRILRQLIVLLNNDTEFNQKILEQNNKLNRIIFNLPPSNVKIKFQSYASRNKPTLEIVSGLLSAYKLSNMNPNIVGVNFVSPEHTPYSMNHYSIHMQIFKILNEDYPQVNLALHAGELALGLVEPEKLKSNITQAVKIAGAKRIGHGVSIAYEDPKTLSVLKERNIPIEINLTSNEVILGVKDEHHPIKLYQKTGVPFVISTDDSGVSRNNLTNEYLKYATRYQPTYAQLKNVVQNSITYSFLSTEDKNILMTDLNQKFMTFEQQH